jgi:uncharacterized protein (DUF1330 family)
VSRQPAYAVAVVRETRFGDAIKTYLEKIDVTLQPFSGKFLVHGGPYEQLEGAWRGDLIIIQFPSMEMARGWYQSDAYQAIRTLRASNTEGDVFLVQGVPDGHRATDILG